MAKSETAQIAQLDERIKSLDANIKQLITDVDAFKDRLSKTNSSGVEQMKKEYQSLQKRVEDLGKSQERTAKSVDEQIQKVSRSRRVDNKILERQNQLLATQKRLASTGDLGQRFSSLKNSLGSIDFNSILATANAKTSGQKILQESTSRLKKAQQDYKNAVDKTTNSIKQQKSSLESMLPTIRRLASAFGVAFSVQGLVQFGKKLVETRGEFEMQFVAMKSIIGDVDAATKIWNQTLQQSLQSPRTFKELTRYTKQLAAYRIETEKLFDTTKRLADVSAGLGVDMGRLILAYGQVKAANYLRASEVRQFTESGVNIYGELAKYFSEIEGRAVGTAEVVERVSKRMVLFSDVEKIFQRMTDEGGTFFNMQEIQADTVLGQINKLHDAYDQMLNTIGQANQGTIRNLLETLNDLVRNWQNVAFVLKGNVNWITLIGAALYALSRNYLKGATTQTLWFSKAIMGNSKVLLKDTADIKIFSKVIGDYSLKTRVAVVATRTLQGALSKLGNVARAIWPLVVFEGAVLLIERLTRASRELKRFREELEAVTSENVGRMNEEISGYDALIKKLQKTNEGTAARKEILDEISNKYGKYLDFIVTEKTTVEELAGAYDNVVSSIRNYTAEKIREEQQQKLEKGIYNEYQDLVDSLTGKRIADAQGKQFKITKEQAKNIAKLIQQSLDEYGVVDIQQILETYFGKALGLTSAGGDNTGIGNLIRSYIGEYNSLKSELQEIRNDIEGETPVFSSDAEYNDYVKRVQAANAALAEQAKKNKQIIKAIKEKTRAESDSWKIEDAISAQNIKNSEEELRIRKQYGLLTEQQYTDALKRLHGELDSYETDYNTRLAKALSDQYGKTWKSSNKEARDMYNYVVSTEDALQQGTLQRNKQLVESYKGLKESLKEYKEQLSAAQKTGAGEDAVKKIQSDIDWATLMMKAIELAAQLRGLDLTDKKKGRTAHNYDSISSLISLLKEMNSEYDKLSKSAYGFAKSNEKVVESFTPAFKEIFGFAGIDISQVDTTSKRATADAMKLVIDTLDKKNLWGKFGSDGGKKARKEFIKAWSQEDVETDIDVQVRIREDFDKEMEKMFSDYELTLDLKKLSLPTGELEGIFDFDLTTIDALRKAVDTFYNEQKRLGADPTDLTKQVEGYYKKIDDMERKSLLERLKTYTEYLTQGRDKAVQIHLDELNKMAEIDELYYKGHYSLEQYRGISSQIKRDTEKKLQENEWREFKESDFYTTMFEDLDHVATSSIDLMISELKKLQKNLNNLDPTQVKEIVKAIDNLEKRKRSRSPIKSFVEDFKKMLRWQKERDAYENALAPKLKRKDELEKEYNRDVLSVAEAEQEYNKLALDGIEGNEAKAKEYWNERLAALNLTKEQLEQVKKEIAEINEKNNEGYGAWVRTYQGISRGAQYFSEMASAAGTIATEMMDMFDDVEDASKKLASDIADIVGNTAALGGDIAKAIASEGSDVGSMIDGLVRTWNIIKGIFSASEADINRTVERETKKLESLEHSLDRVKRARDKAWDTVTVVQNEKDVEQAINDQIAAYDALIAAEQSRKNPNDDTLRQWKNEREQLYEQLEEEREEFLKKFGGIGESDYLSAAEGFVNAWKQAFLDTGDGLQGLQDHFDEFLQDWFTKQATMLIARKYLDTMFEQIDDAVQKNGSGGVEVMWDEIQSIMDTATEQFPAFSAELEEFFRRFGGLGEGSLSGLAAGIQGMTEEQANILEAYWNSVRMYTASIDMNVARIAEMLGVGGANTNPLLQQMSLIAANTQATHQLLQSVTKSGHSQGGYGIKVFND